MNRRFWKVAKDRALRSAAQVALLTLGVIFVADDAPMLDAFAADWQAVASFSLGAAIASLLNSIAFPPKEVDR